MEEYWVHTPDGRLLSALDAPGTKVKRKDNLPYGVRGEFPVGVVKTISEDCGRKDKGLTGRFDRPTCHVKVANDYCFHPYRDTLEVVDGATDTQA